MGYMDRYKIQYTGSGPDPGRYRELGGKGIRLEGNRVSMEFDSWLARKILEEGCCQAEAVSYLWADPDQEDVLDYFASYYDLDTVRLKDVQEAADEVYRKMQAAIAASGLPEEIQVWRCGELAGDVTSVTTSEEVAHDHCARMRKYGGYTDINVSSYMVKRSDVLVSIDHLWVGGDFDESELLVRPSALVPLSRSENPLSAHPTPRGSSQRNQMHPHATRMLADYWRAFTPDDVHPWLDDMYAGVHVTPWAFAALAYALQKRELWEDEWGREEVVNPGVLLGISADIEAGPYDADALTFARTLVQDLFPGLLEEEDLWDEEGRFDAEAFWDWQDDYYDGFASDYVSEGEYLGLGSIAGDVANRPQLAAFIEELEAGNAGEGWTREMLEEEPEMSALKIAAEVVPQGRILGEVPASQIVAVVVVENYPPGQDGDFAEEFEAAGKEFPYWADEAEVDLENFSNKVLEEGTTVWGDPDKAEFWHGTSLDNAKAALPEILTPDVIERAEVAGRLWPDPPDPYDEEDDE